MALKIRLWRGKRKEIVNDLQCEIIACRKCKKQKWKGGNELNFCVRRRNRKSKCERKRSNCRRRRRRKKKTIAIVPYLQLLHRDAIAKLYFSKFSEILIKILANAAKSNVVFSCLQDLRIGKSIRGGNGRGPKSHPVRELHSRSSKCNEKSTRWRFDDCIPIRWTEQLRILQVNAMLTPYAVVNI